MRPFTYGVAFVAVVAAAVTAPMHEAGRWVIAATCPRTAPAEEARSETSDGEAGTTALLGETPTQTANRWARGWRDQACEDIAGAYEWGGLQVRRAGERLGGQRDDVAKAAPPPYAGGP